MFYLATSVHRFSPHNVALQLASLSRARLAVALVVCTSVVLCSPNYVLYGPVSLTDQPGFWIDYNEIVVPAYRVSHSVTHSLNQSINQSINVIF